MSALKRHTASSLIRSFISGVRAVVPVMLKQDPGARGVRGSLLTIASNAAHHGAPEKAVSERMFLQNLPGADRKLQSLQPYCASKGALVSLNKCLAVVGSAWHYSL